MTWREHVSTALAGVHPRLGRSVAFLLQGLIVLSMVSISVETLPDLPPWTAGAFRFEETLVVLIFTVEYLLRLAAAERPLRYATSFFGVVDLLAILPFYLSLGFDLRAFRAFRLLRLFRLLKLARYSAAAVRLRTALATVREELVVFLSVAAILLYLCSICIYYFEHDAQPQVFASVFHAMWWAAITLTTVGYGDMVPITLGGRIFTILMLTIALGIIAVPTGLVASALSQMRKESGGDPNGR